MATPPPNPSPTPSYEATTKAETPTQETMKAVGSHLNLVAWLSSGFGALATVLGVAAVVTIGSFAIIDRSEAAGKQAARDEIRVEFAPLKQEVAFHGRQLEFMVKEQRDTRLDIRAAFPAPTFLYLAPIPTLDGGP